MWTDWNHPGGYGRKHRWRDSNCSVLRCWEMGPLKTGPGPATFRVRWTESGNTVDAAVSVRDGDRWLRLSYSIRGEGIVQMIRMPGDGVAGRRGQRYWFACPRCERRCGTLYLGPQAPHGFVCRGCVPGGVTYESRQRLNPARLFGAMRALLNKPPRRR